MSTDLKALLAQAEDALTQDVAAAGVPATTGLRAAVARRRRARHVREAAGGLAVLATVVGVATWAAAGTGPVPPTVEPAHPTVTTSPSPSPSASPSTAPTAAAPPTQVPPAPVLREAQIDDATVLARRAAPRTGEVWTTPVAAPEMAAVLDPEGGSTPWRVGQRGASTIYVVAGPPDEWPVPARVSGVYEVDAGGVRAVLCPSARTGDPCTDPALPAGVARDEQTFYDTMTLPRAVDLAPGWRLTTTATTGTAWYAQVLLGSLGAADAFDTVTVVADLGAGEIVRMSRPAEVAGLTDVQYALRTPYGATIDLSADDAPSGEFARIRWDDGVARPLDRAGSAQSTSPGRGACVAGTFAVEARHVPGDWRAAGTTPGGNRVYVPVAGGNAVSRAVRAWQAGTSSTLDDATGDVVTDPASYPYATDEQFLAADALYAIQGPDGVWQLRLRADAVQTVWECA